MLTSRQACERRGNAGRSVENEQGEAPIGASFRLGLERLQAKESFLSN
jgi:hypothetical protein